jgi:hypothetical protein
MLMMKKDVVEPAAVTMNGSRAEYPFLGSCGIVFK